MGEGRSGFRMIEANISSALSECAEARQARRERFPHSSNMRRRQRLEKF